MVGIEPIAPGGTQPSRDTNSNPPVPEMDSGFAPSRGRDLAAHAADDVGGSDRPGRLYLP